MLFIYHHNYNVQCSKIYNKKSPKSAFTCKQVNVQQVFNRFIHFMWLRFR